MKKHIFKLYGFLIVLLCAICSIHYHVDHSVFTADPISPLVASTVIFTPDIWRAKLENFYSFVRGLLLRNNPGMSDNSIDLYLQNLDIREYQIRNLWDLQNNQNTYVTDFKEGYTGTTLAALRSLEILVPDKKVFFPAFFRIAVSQYDEANNVLSDVMTYPDSEVFNGTGEQASIRAVWNGVHSIQTDNLQRTTNLSNDRCKFIPQQQREVITDISFLPEYGPDPASKGFYSCNPAWVLDTTKKNTASVTLYGKISAVAGEAGAYNILRVESCGFLWDPQSVSQFDYLIPKRG